MRPSPVVDDDLYDDLSPRVIPVGAANRPRDAVSPDTEARDGVEAPARQRPEPWTPRDYPLPAPPRRAARPVEPEPPASRLTRTHKLMVALFGLVCLSMLLGSVAWRLVNEARRPADPAAATASVAQRPAQPPASAAVPSEAQQPPAAPGTGPISTEIRVVQPNYTVATGDTLASIARRHGTTVDALASINNLENRNSLGVGQRLIIP